MATGVTGTAPLLTVSGLSLSYGRLRALDDVNLNVQSGELVALAGENGAGKTTLGAAPQNIWTAVVLLAAVTVDTLARRRSSTS